MRKLAIRSLLALTLCVGLAAVATADDDDEMEKPAESTSWTDWILPGEKPEPKKKVEKAVVAEPAGPSAAELAETARRREYEAYFRRIQVCDRLMEVAINKNDLDLQRRIEETMEKIGEVYARRTAGLGRADLDAPPQKPLDKAKAGGTRGNNPNRKSGESE